VLAFFYFSSRSANKKDALNLLSSVLLQLSYQSDDFYRVLSSAFPESAGSASPPPRRDIDTLRTYLRRILTLEQQVTIYFVIDALDECASPSEQHLDYQSWIQTRGREDVFKILEELLDLKLPHLRLCVTSRLETDIEEVLEPFNPRKVSLDTQPGHIETLAQFVKLSVNSDRTMQKWSDETKDLVIDTLGKESGGMYVIIVVMLRTELSCDGFQVSVGRLSVEDTAHLLRAGCPGYFKGITKDSRRDVRKHIKQHPREEAEIRPSHVSVAYSFFSAAVRPGACRSHSV